MDSKQEERFIQLINQGIQEVVIPAMQTIDDDLRKDLKKEIKSLRSEMNERFDRLERSDDRMADEQVDLRARIRRVENAVFKKVD